MDFKQMSAGGRRPTPPPAAAKAAESGLINVLGETQPHPKPQAQEDFGHKNGYSEEVLWRGALFHSLSMELNAVTAIPAPESKYNVSQQAVRTRKWGLGTHD